jgi:hypothetical protein
LPLFKVVRQSEKLSGLFDSTEELKPLQESDSLGHLGLESVANQSLIVLLGQDTQRHLVGLSVDGGGPGLMSNKGQLPKALPFPQFVDLLQDLNLYCVLKGNHCV